MGECRFGLDEQTADFCVVHYASQALCAHAAAELERRVEVAYRMVAKAESDAATLESRLTTLQRECGIYLEQDHGLSLAEVCRHLSDCLARLEEEKARAEKWTEHWKQQVEAARRDKDYWGKRCDEAEAASRDWEECYARTKLERDEAEARVAAMREALEHAREFVAVFYASGGRPGMRNAGDTLDEIAAALSPGAGRAR